MMSTPLREGGESDWQHNCLTASVWCQVCDIKGGGSDANENEAAVVVGPIDIPDWHVEHVSQGAEFQSNEIGILVEFGKGAF